jgi:hypothetical protein
MTETDDLLARFGEGIRRFLDRAGKAQHSSGVFDLQRRTLMGTYVYFDHLPWVLSRLGEVTTPEVIGRAGRGICGRPTGAQIHGLLWAYLLGRENELALGRSGGDPAELELVVDWWHRMIGAYRDDAARLLPHEDGDRQRAASDAEIAVLLDTYGRAPQDLPDAAKVTASLQMYNFVLRGEQRGTTNFHGPYAGSQPGRTILVEEFTRLRTDELPWRARPAVQPFDTVCAILELEDVRFRFDLFSGMAADPPDHRSRLRRVALVSCDGDAPRSLEPDEREAVLAACDAERGRLFRETLSWDADYKIEYGAFHYLDFLMPFVEAAGAPGKLKDEIRRRAASTVAARLREIAEVEPVPVFARLFSSPDRLFTPSSATAGALHG